MKKAILTFTFIALVTSASPFEFSPQEKMITGGSVALLSGTCLWYCHRKVAKLEQQLKTFEETPLDRKSLRIKLERYKLLVGLTGIATFAGAGVALCGGQQWLEHRSLIGTIGNTSFYQGRFKQVITKNDRGETVAKEKMTEKDIRAIGKIAHFYQEKKEIIEGTEKLEEANPFFEEFEKVLSFDENEVPEIWKKFIIKMETQAEKASLTPLEKSIMRMIAKTERDDSSKFD